MFVAWQVNRNESRQGKNLRSKKPSMLSPVKNPIPWREEHSLRQLAAVQNVGVAEGRTKAAKNLQPKPGWKPSPSSTTKAKRFSNSSA